MGTGITVTFSGFALTGSAAENYTLTAQPAGVTADITEKDIANAVITLGDILIYSGGEQTQTVTKVEIDGLEVTGDISGDKATNVGVYQLTVTGNGNFTGTASILYKVLPDISAVDGLDTDNVTSDNKEAIEQLKEILEDAALDLATDDKKAELQEMIDICDDLLEGSTKRHRLPIPRTPKRWRTSPPIT